MKRIIAFSLLIFSSIGSAELYKWTDADGVVHYTDRLPSADVQQDYLPARLKSLRTGNSQETSEENSVYSTFSINQPAPEATVRTDNATVDIVVQIEPPLTENHFLQSYLDGLEVGDKTKSTALTLQEMQFGTHRLQARIIDNDNLEIMKTAEVTFSYREPLDLSTVAPNLATQPE